MFRTVEAQAQSVRWEREADGFANGRGRGVEDLEGGEPCGFGFEAGENIVEGCAELYGLLASQLFPFVGSMTPFDGDVRRKPSPRPGWSTAVRSDMLRGRLVLVDGCGGRGVKDEVTWQDRAKHRAKTVVVKLFGVDG